MTRGRSDHRTDANQAEIVRAIRRCGCLVHSTSGVGGGFPDLLVGCDGVLYLLEVKDGSKPPSKQRLTPDEKAWHELWRDFEVHVVASVDEALTAVGVPL